MGWDDLLGRGRGVGVRSFYPPPRQYTSRQTTRLHAVAWVVCLAVRLGMSCVTVCSDSEVALAHVLAPRACSHLQHQQAILRSLARVLWVSGLVVRLVWVPPDLQPGNPMPRVNSEHEGSQANAEVRAWDIQQRMLCHLDACKIRGVLCLRDC